MDNQPKASSATGDNSAIEQAIFALESVAHLQGRERDLLPITDKARAELVEVIAILETVLATKYRHLPIAKVQALRKALSVLKPNAATIRLYVTYSAKYPHGDYYSVVEGRDVSECYEQIDRICGQKYATAYTELSFEGLPERYHWSEIPLQPHGPNVILTTAPLRPTSAPTSSLQTDNGSDSQSEGDKA